MNNKVIVEKIYNKLKKEVFFKEKVFNKNETITNYIANRNYVYFILDGNARLLKNTKHGDEILVEEYYEYDFFGDMFYDVIKSNEMFVSSRVRCKVFYFDYDLIVGNIKYLEIIELMLMILNNRLKKMNFHTELLVEKSIRDKLLTYMNTNKSSNNIVTFDISYKDFAKYLNVNRSSLMKELKLLEDDKLIKRNKKNIKILY